MSAYIEIADVSKRVVDGAHSKYAVEALTLSIDRGERVLLAGPSGSGKTSLLMLLGLLSRPTEGEIRIDGLSVSRMREHHRTAYRRERLGVVLQDLLLVPDLDVFDNVLLPRVPDGITRTDRERAQALVERFGLADRLATKVQRLSGGERQRIALARALLREPSLLLLDEPTAHLDDANTAALVEVLDAERDAGRTIVLATHDPRLLGAPGPGARIVRMRAGRIEPG